MSAILTLTTFSPAEAERITGVSMVQQRDWRRRGFLRSHDGHARFDPFDLAETWALKMLANRDIGPTTGKELSPPCGRSIVWNALAWPDAFEGDHGRVFEWQPDLFAEIEAVHAKRQAAVAVFQADPTPDKLAVLEEISGPGWEQQADWLRRRIWSERNLPRVVPARFFIWWPTGEECWHESLDAAFDGLSSSEPKVAGSAVIMDQQALGSALVERAGRALVHVEISSAS